jgi:GntR family transcriptional repressor for pyruvate dehydrogenase complex
MTPGTVRITKRPMPETRTIKPAAAQAATDGPSTGMQTLRRVRKAYEQVYDQLRDMILSGDLPQGHRLPNEAQLAAQFGVSRSTVREALRLLVAESLVRTAKGATGGSFVTLPTVDHVSEFLVRNMELLSHTDDVTLPEFLEARELIEVFAVRQAAIRRTAEDIEALRATLVPPDSDMSADAQYVHNKEFHAVLVDACGNALLRIAAQPIFFVLHTHLARSTLTLDFPRKVCAEHRLILEAIEAGDPDVAETRMRDHLSDLAVVYGKIWRRGSSSTPAG